MRQFLNLLIGQQVLITNQKQQGVLEFKEGSYSVRNYRFQAKYVKEITIPVDKVPTLTLS